MKPKFMSSTNSNGKSMVHIKNDNAEIMIGENTDKINQELFDSLQRRLLTGLEQSIQGSNSVLDYVNGLDYKCHSISINRGESYIDSPEWIKSKNDPVNPQKKGNNAVTAALHHESIGKNPQKTARIRPLSINTIGKK